MFCNRKKFDDEKILPKRYLPDKAQEGNQFLYTTVHLLNDAQSKTFKFGVDANKI